MKKVTNKKVLIVVDMQEDFVYGALRNEDAIAIICNVNKKIAQNRAAGSDVVFTRDTHEENYLSTNEGKNLPVEHCIRGTAGWKIISEIDVKDDKIIDKPTFGSMELLDYVATLDVDEIELIGVCTGICVISNAMLLKAKFPEKEIIVDSTCCACVTPASHSNALEAMKMCHIIVK